MAQTTRRVDLPMLGTRAAITPQSINEEERTVELVFSTGAAVVRRDWEIGRYIERLQIDPKSVRLERLNSGAPLLNTHNGWSLQDQIGVVEQGSARIQGKKAIARVRFSTREDVESIWRDVVAGIIRNVSVGYVVHKVEETAGDDKKLPTRTAVDWEPYEISLVPMPADAMAQTRTGKIRSDEPDTHPCEIVSRSEDPDPAEDPNMKPDTKPDTRTDARPDKSEYLDEGIAGKPDAPAGNRIRPADDDPPEPNERDLGGQAERERVQGIMKAVRAARLPSTFADKLIASGEPLVDCQRKVFDELAGREPEIPRSSATRVEVGDSPTVHVRAGIENALLHRVSPNHFELSDVGREYRGMSMLDIAKAYLNSRGTRTTNLSRKEIAGLALGLDTRAGMHTTSDFALLLADVANKTLRRAYDEQPQTFAPLVRTVTVSDFKTIKRNQLGDAPSLVEIEEDGEYTSGTISEGRETYQLATYGRKFAITRKALINDDLDAFSRVPMMFGRKARILESNLVWQQITSNPVMGDSNNLFHSAHSNLAAAGAAISVASLGEGRAALRQQTSLDGDYMNLMARFLIVPTALETTADQYVTVVTPQQAGNVNPFQNRLTVIAEPRLDVEPDAWYLAASPDQIDTIEIAYLEGEMGPMVESRSGFDVDGLEIKCRQDVAAKAIDWRWIFKNWGNT